jgi:hypothetical protein
LLLSAKAGKRCGACCKDLPMTRTDLVAGVEEPVPQTYTHPEEMLFALELRLPRQSALAMRFRTTPAGLVTTGLLTLMTLAGVALIRRSR